MKIALVRGPYLNKGEMANYELLAKKHELRGFSSLHHLHSTFEFPVVRLPSLCDLPLVPSHRIKMAILNRLFGDAMILFGLEEKLNGFDIAHTAETYFYFTKQCLGAKKKGLVSKVVATVWENIPHNNEGIWGRREMKQKALAEVDHFFAATYGAKQALIEEGCHIQKISLIPMGVDLKKFKVQKLKIKNRDDFNKNKTNILFIGRLENEKGIWEIVKAVSMLTIPYHLTMVGEGSQKQRLKQKIEAMRLEDSITITSCSYNQIESFYNQTDIFVLASKSTTYWQEQFGMVLVEAMASGLPIVATDSGAIKEVVGDVGLFAKEADSKNLFDQINRLVKDSHLREKMARNARKRAETYYDCEKVAKKIEQVYLSLL